jgi:hypothetical protein
MSIADKLTTIAANVQKVYDAGKAAGGGGGAGYDEGFAEGRQAEYDRFWDAFQQNGNRNYYQNAFASQVWDDTIYNPKYPIVGTQHYSVYNTFNGCNQITSTKVPIYASNGIMQSAFSGCASLVTIPLLRLENIKDFNSCFTNCKKLANITIEGSIDVNFNISASGVLTNESVQSIIDHLKDLTGATTQTLTFHTDVKITTNQINAAKGKNWTVVGGTEVANDYFDG